MHIRTLRRYYAIAAAIVIAFWGGVGYVVFHFVCKYW